MTTSKQEKEKEKEKDAEAKRDSHEIDDKVQVRKEKVGKSLG